ncbi:reprolysin-like metallopeptidase [Ideonella sp. A 288]|uniref:reprolysin-like metallopeptidase n=1 Tax=Ideonella sp. A 288 TaxID=1962181 RepID=UPI000B4AE57F|nr:matrixin [Ideonella sp. A 288]
MATVTEATTVRTSGDRRADALMDSFANWNFLTPDITPAANTLYFTFAMSTPLTEAAPDRSPAAFNASQTAAARAVLAHVASITGIAFVETTSPASADLHFANADLAGSQTTGLTSTSWGYGYSGETLSSYTAEAYVFLDDVEWRGSTSAPQAGNAGYETLLHEVGHAMGLHHPFEGQVTLPATEDHTDNTVMSYTSRGTIKSEFQAYDKLALAWIYGGDGLGGTWGYNASRGLSLTPGTPPAGLTLVGGANADTLVGGEGADSLSGGGADDRLRGNAGNDRLDGGSGLDTADHGGPRSAYTAVRSGTGWSVNDGRGIDGTDTLVGIERLRFSDGAAALDTDSPAGHAAQVARIIGAVFGPSTLAQRELVGIGLDLLDRGVGYAELLDLAVGTELFAQLAGGRSNAAFVSRVYLNVVGSAPSAAEHAHFQGLLDSGVHTQASLALLAADTDVNALHIDLAGLATTGLDYIPQG